jgi:hypothetical protein
MARYPKLVGFNPKRIKHLSDGLIVVQVGSEPPKLWTTGIMRKVVPCALCQRTIAKRDRGWRELLQTALYRAKRVCTQCWPYEKEEKHDEHDHDGATPQTVPAGDS